MLQQVIKKINHKNSEIAVFKVVNSHNDELILTNYGATVMSVKAYLGNKIKKDIALGFEEVEDFIKNCEQEESSYFGSTVGRYANRIANASFRIGEEDYILSKNEGNNHLHGGFEGLHKVIWNYKIIEEGILFSYISKDGSEGYPGNLETTLLISLNNDREITLNYIANSDKPTPVNLTNHLYFNLNGGVKNILDHFLTINSNQILEKNSSNIPTGNLLHIENTEFDFQLPTKLMERINPQHPGYDQTFVIDKEEGDYNFAARIEDENNKLSVELFTTEPSIQLYTANHFDGKLTGKQKTPYNKFYGICLEAQKFPDSPNHEKFPSSILWPGKEYNQKTTYKIKVNE